MIKLGQVVLLATPDEEQSTSPVIYTGMETTEEGKTVMGFITPYKADYIADDVESVAFLVEDGVIVNGPFAIDKYSGALGKKDIKRREFKKYLKTIKV